MIWHKAGQWAWASDCGTYAVTAAQLDGLRYGYSAWVTGHKSQHLLTTLDAAEARKACEAHKRSAGNALQGETTELQFGEQEVQR